MNEIENDYTTLGMPNILFEQRKNSTNNTEITADNTLVDPFIFPLMKRLAQARPQWKFVAGRRRVASNSNFFHVSAFEVYEGNAILGRVWKDYENRGDVICINNKRMSAERQRGSASTTQDLKKAFKLVTKNFHGLTVAEAVKDAAGEVHAVVFNLHNKNRAEFHHKYDTLSPFLMAYTMNNWEHMRQTAIDVGISPALLDGMPEAYDAYKATRDINNTMGDDTGATVVIRGDEYIVVVGGATSIFDTEHLPPHIKRSVGILKLVEEQTFVEGHGARVAKDKFFVSSKAGAAS